MKKLLLIICTCLIAVSATAQEKFTVPSLTDQQKYNTAAWQWNGAYIIMIKYAKSLGKTVEEAAEAVGSLAASTWNREMTFDDLVKSMLYIYVVMNPAGKVEILEQSADKVIISITDFYKPLDQMLAEYKVTRSELSKFYEIYAGQIAAIIGAALITSETGEVMTVTVSKN